MVSFGVVPLPPYFQPPLGPSKPTPREQVSAEWRGINLAPLEKAQSLTARSTGDLLPRVLSDIRLDRRRAEAEVVKVWNHLLEPDITAHAQPTGLRKGTLFVTVDSSAWLCEIVRNRRREILKRLRHSFGRDLIARISFRVG
jgi:predicted nucleic acid-binding Zn ribbon protein